MVGSYEHNLLCVALSLEKEPLFTPIFHFQAHALSIKSIDIARRHLVTGSSDEHIRIYDLHRRKELGTLLSHQGTVTTLRFSAGQDDHGVKLGRWLLSGSDDGRILVWRTKDWELFGTLKGHTGRVNDLAIHPLGKVAISVSSDFSVRLWNLMTAKKAAVLKIKGRDHTGQAPEFVRWCAAGTHFVVGFSSKLFYYKLDDEAVLLHKIDYKAALMCVEVVDVAGSEYLATGHSDGSVALTPVALVGEGTFAPAFTLRGHSNRVKGLAYMCNAETQNVPYLVSILSDGRIVVWDLSTEVRDQVAVYDTGERLNCVAVCGDSVEGDVKRAAEASELEYETDGEAPVRRAKRAKTAKVSVVLE